MTSVGQLLTWRGVRLQGESRTKWRFDGTRKPTELEGQVNRRPPPFKGTGIVTRGRSGVGCRTGSAHAEGELARLTMKHSRHSTDSNAPAEIYQTCGGGGGGGGGLFLL